MITTKTIIRPLVILFILAACDSMNTSERLQQIDSLVARQQYDSAYVLLSNLDRTGMTTDDQAHFYLLSTQLGYLTNQPLPSDSRLDTALIYYNKVGNNQKLAEAYYYKSYRSMTDQNYPQAIQYCKEAEKLATSTDDARLQFKVAEFLAYLNGLCENDALLLQYAQKALSIAQKVHNKNWMAYSYNKISFAFHKLGKQDSAYFYIEKSIPYIEDIYDADKAVFLMNMGVLYKADNPGKAKELFEKALTYEELPEIIEHLADVYYSLGNKDEAYKLWKKALTKDSRYDKINLIHSIISYDLERGNIEEVSKNVDEIINIKDSILNKLKNDTIKDLQLRFDHEVAMHEADRALGRTQNLLMGLAIVLTLLAFYAYFRKKRAEAKEKEYQDQLYAYTTEIKQLTANRDITLANIQELISREEKDQQKISQLEAEAKEAEGAIKQLNKSIKKLLDDEATKLKQGKMLYDHIAEGNTSVNWSSKEEELFCRYYAAINFQSYNRIRKVKRSAKLSAHNLFYLILKELGYSDEDVRRIMVLSPEGLRSIRSRTKPAKQEK